MAIKRAMEYISLVSFLKITMGSLLGCVGLGQKMVGISLIGMAPPSALPVRPVQVGCYGTITVTGPRVFQPTLGGPIASRQNYGA